MDLIAVTHMHRGLFDDRAGIELFGDVMRCGANQLDPRSQARWWAEPR